MTFPSLLPLLLFVLIDPLIPQVSGSLYQNLDNLSENPAVDDGSSPQIPFHFTYFGRTYENIYVNHNGHLTFDNPYSSFTPSPFPMNGGFDIIAPLWTDMDNRDSGHITYGTYTSGPVLAQATQDINTYFPGLSFTASNVLVATWDRVPYFLNPSTASTYQAVLINGQSNSFLLLNYEQIDDTGRNIQAGYDSINSTDYFSMAGSFTSNAAGPNSYFVINSNVNVPGRWAFQLDFIGCSLDGELFQVGDFAWTDDTCAQKCTCIAHQQLECVPEPCSFGQLCQPKASTDLFACQTVQRKTCTIFGDPHYDTFDDSKFDFQGTCTYVLSEVCDDQLSYYRVEGKNEHRGSTLVSWTKLVKVFVYNEIIELVKDQRGKAKVNDIFVNTPFSLSNGAVQVYFSVFELVISTDFGLVVTYDAHSTVKIRVPYTYMHATCGLCGNFNNNPDDDFKTRDGDIVISDVDFANSWLAPGDNETGCEVQCSGLHCSSCPELDTYSDATHCGIIDLFAPCHQHIPPGNYIQSCVYDLCVGNGYQPILCQALNAYVRECQQYGVQLEDWRTTTGLCEIQCPANSHYESQGTGCPATCVNPNSPDNCPLPAQESCLCNSGFVLSGDVCVPFEDCGCSFEGQYYSSGETVILDDDCGRRCTCQSGSMSCEAHSCGLWESCRVEEGERRCMPKSYKTCWISGPGLYHTFDGHTFMYPGACQLTLAKKMTLVFPPRFDLNNFQVKTVKVPRGQGFARFLKFEADGTQISIEMAATSTVQVDGQPIRLPYSSPSNNIQVFRSSIHSIIIRTSFGVTVQTVWPHFVSITAPFAYMNNLRGVCGNYNGLSFDDVTPDSQKFGDSWRGGSTSAKCLDIPQTTTQTSENCNILENEPFTPCWTSKSQQLMGVCTAIVGASTDPSSTRCEILQDYALICQQNGMDLPNWRTAAGCELTCPQNSQYKLCESPCPSTCPTLSFPFTCDNGCQEGCQCNDGLVLSDNECVPPTSCGCYHNGRYRQSGESFWDGEECQSLCTCDGTTGIVHCAPSSCEAQESCRVVGGEPGCHPDPHGTCSASGDPHYLTFDRKAYDFQGTCRYVLAKLCDDASGPPQFSVEAKNEPWRGLSVAVTAEVFVNVFGYQIRMSLNMGGMVEINGIIANLPLALDDNVYIFASGSRTFVNTHSGPNVTYDGSHTVSISVPSSYRDKTCGLCGNFNGNQNDEFRTPLGLVVTSPDEFGTSWKVPGDDICSNGCGSSCPQCIDASSARTQCGLITARNGPFSFCHESVLPGPYFDDCVFDFCVSGNQAYDILCMAMEAYVSACQSANVHIYQWRENTPCSQGISCSANSHYELCGTDCGHNCASSFDATCEQSCSEGCFCDEGFVRSGTECINAESCGCEYSGLYYNAGESFWNDGCTEHCKCHGPNDMQCLPASCTPTQGCTIRDGHHGCFDEMTTCTVWGDPHYVTFDGVAVDFQGTCTYIITQSVGNEDINNQFKVLATNEHRDHNQVSFVSAVDVHLSNQTHTMNIRIDSNKIVTVNGNDVSLPTAVETFAWMEHEGSFIIVDAGDLVVHFDGISTLLVRLKQRRRNKVTGICGNFNLDPADDKVLPSGILAQNDNEFGNSWKASTSAQSCGSTDEGVPDDPTCPLLEQHRDLCNIINNSDGPFSACHVHVDPEAFFNACVYDLCLYSSQNGMLCKAISGYEMTCTVLELDIPEWRSSLDCAESDPCENQHCLENEWCGEKDGIHDCFCDEDHHRPNSETYDSSITCSSSTATVSLSRCQLFEAGFTSGDLHLMDDTCTGTIQDGRLVFHFDNDENLCDTVQGSNATHYYFTNSIQGQVDFQDGETTNQRNVDLSFICEFPLDQD